MKLRELFESSSGFPSSSRGLGDTTRGTLAGTPKGMFIGVPKTISSGTPELRRDSRRMQEGISSGTSVVIGF